MKQIENLKVGDTCYWFNMHGEFEGQATVESIKVDDDKYISKRYYIKLKDLGTVSVRENMTYGHSIDFPDMIAFFSKESAITYFLNEINGSISNLNNSVKNLF